MWAPLVLYFLGVTLLVISGDYCGENRAPVGLEVHLSGQPYLLCAKPNCFEKKFSDCEDRAFSLTCNDSDTWVGGFTKDYGIHLPLYLQCCKLDELSEHSISLFSITVRSGEYFEGELETNPVTDDVVAFDYIADMRMLIEANDTTAYEISINRLRCSELPSNSIRRKRLRKWP